LKGLPGKNAQAYLALLKLVRKKSFITLDPGGRTVYFSHFSMVGSLNDMHQLFVTKTKQKMDPDNPRNNYITGKKLKRCRKN
jgi:hypothetical protein